MKNRMLLSILALVGASLLLVGATLAWFTISQTVSNNDIDLAVINVDATVTLEQYVNSKWVPTTQINIQNSVPGNTYQYRLVITNIGNVGLKSNVILASLYSEVSTPSLLDAYQIAATNSKNAYEITTKTLSAAIADSINTSSPNLLIAKDFSLAIGGFGYVYFTLTLPSSVTNQYQNIALEIRQIRITLATE